MLKKFQISHIRALQTRMILLENAVTTFLQQHTSVAKHLVEVKNSFI